MDTLNLNTGEAIIRTTQTIIINGVRHEAVLTDRRLVLVESETGHIHEDIPFEDISRADAGVNRIREPVITLSFNSPGREKRIRELIFIRLTGNRNVIELETCLAILKQHNVPVENSVRLTEDVRLDRVEKANTGVLPDIETVSRPAVPDWSGMGLSHRIRKPQKEESPERSPLFLIAAVVFIIVVFASGAVIMGQIMYTKNVPVNQSVTRTDIPTNVIPSPTLTPVPPQQETSQTAISVTMNSIPSYGIWVRVSYPGNYSGYIGAPGRHLEVNSSGIQLYQLPVQDTMIEGFIEKGDGSAGKLEVEISNGGTIVSRSETAKPYGIIELHAPVGPAIGSNAEITPLPTTITASPYASLPRVSIPLSGVWVRIFYPGNFVGAIGANGQMRNINNTGDQFYQVSLTSGMIEGSVEKQDGSVRTLIIEVYKDGIQISQYFTSTPLGVVDIHVKV